MCFSDGELHSSLKSKDKSKGSLKSSSNTAKVKVPSLKSDSAFSFPALSTSGPPPYPSQLAAGFSAIGNIGLAVPLFSVPTSTTFGPGTSSLQEKTNSLSHDWAFSSLIPKVTCSMQSKTTSSVQVVTASSSQENAISSTQSIMTFSNTKENASTDKPIDTVQSVGDHSVNVQRSSTAASMFSIEHSDLDVPLEELTRKKKKKKHKHKKSRQEEKAENPEIEELDRHLQNLAISETNSQPRTVHPANDTAVLSAIFRKSQQRKESLSYKYYALAATSVTRRGIRCRGRLIKKKISVDRSGSSSLQEGDDDSEHCLPLKKRHKLLAATQLTPSGEAENGGKKKIRKQRAHSNSSVVQQNKSSKFCSGYFN